MFLSALPDVSHLSARFHRTGLFLYSRSGIFCTLMGCILCELLVTFKNIIVAIRDTWWLMNAEIHLPMCAFRKNYRISSSANALPWISEDTAIRSRRMTLNCLQIPWLGNDYIDFIVIFYQYCNKQMFLLNRCILLLYYNFVSATSAM